MSKMERRVLSKLAEKLVDELSEAYARTPYTVSSWVNVRKAYLLALSLKRIVEREDTDI